jgi:hypothetical protein
VITKVLRLFDSVGTRGISEASLIRSFPGPQATATQITQCVNDLKDLGYVRRTIKTRTGGWVYVVTPAGIASLE